MPIVGTDELFAEVVRRLGAIDPVKVIAFGSRVRGDAGRQSDLDLVVVEAGGGTLGERGVRVRGALGDVGVPIDLVVYTPEEYERLRGWRSSIASIADREGIVLHETRRSA